MCNVVLDVHVKQDCSPGKGTFLSEKDKVQHRARVTMPSMGTSATEKKDHHLRYCTVLSVFHHRVTRSSTTEDTEGTEFEIFIETQMNIDFRKGK